MALTIVLGLTILSVTDYGNTYEFAGQLKSTITPFSALPNQHYQGDQFKSAFGYNSVPPKPFGAPFEHFKQSYQPNQQYRMNDQPFGPYPSYQRPVVYPGHGGCRGPEAYRVDEPNHKPFGFQSFPAPVQPEFNQYKFGPSKKFNKNFPGLADFNQAGKYFQEHQFGAYHGPEFSSAIIPAEHNIKQSRPKDTLLGKPIEFGLPKQTSFGFPSLPSFGYPVPNFPPVKPLASTTSSIKSVPATFIPVNAVKVEQKFGGAKVTTTIVPSAANAQFTIPAGEVPIDGVIKSAKDIALAQAQAQKQSAAPTLSLFNSNKQPTNAGLTDNGGLRAQIPIGNGGLPTEISIENGGLPTEIPIDNGGLPAETPIDNGGLPAETPIDNGGLTTELPIDNGGIPVETPIDNGGLPAETPIDNGVLPAETPIDNRGLPAEPPIENGGLPAETPINNGELPAEKPIDNGELTTEVPIEDGGLPAETPINNGELTTKVPIENGGLSAETPINNGELPAETPIDNGGLTTEVPIEDGGLPAETPINNGELTTKVPIENGGLSAETPINNGELTTKVPIENGGLSAETPINNGELPTEIPIDNEGLSAETPIDKGGLPADVPIDKGELPAETPIDNGGLLAETPINSGELPAETPIDNGGLPAETPIENGGLFTEVPNDKGGLPAETPIDKGGLPAEVPIDKGGLPAETPIDNGGLTTEAPINNGGLTTKVPIDNEGLPAKVPNDNAWLSFAPIQASNTSGKSSAAVSGPSKSQSVAAENKPVTGSAAANWPGLPVELQNMQFGPVPISDTSSLGQFGSSGFPYFGQSAGAQQPSYYPYFNAPGFSTEDQKAFAANLAAQVPQSGQVFGSSASPAVNILQDVTVSNPSAEIATLLESVNNAKIQDKAVSNEKQKQNITPSSPFSPSLPNGLKSQPKFNPFNGQLPLLYNPSNSAAPLDTYKFYNHPSVPTWSSQASMASYSPVSAFNNFGSHLHQGYFAEGSPMLTPLAKTVVQSGPTPLSISSPDHPLHSQVFKYSQSFVPYPGLVATNNDAATFQPFGVPSFTAAPAAACATTATAAGAAPKFSFSRLPPVLSPTNHPTLPSYIL